MLAEAERPVALEALEAEGSVHRIIGFHPPLPSSSKPFSYLDVWPFVSHGFVDFVFGGGGNACFPPGACLPALRGLNLHHQLNTFSSGLVVSF